MANRVDKYKNLQKVAERAYAPYSKKKDACMIEYLDSHSESNYVVGVTLENCAYPNSISAVHSAIMDLRTRHRHNETFTVTAAYTLAFPCPRDLALLHEVASFGADDASAKLFYGEEGIYPTESDCETSMFKSMPTSTLSALYEYSVGHKTPEPYASFKYVGDTPLTEDERNCIQTALEGMQTAFPAKSSFSVGAAFQILFDDGSIETLSGGNVEPTNLGDTLCAERIALCRITNMLRTSTASRKPTRILRGCVSLFSDAVASPCGSCRQNLSEWGNYPMLLLKCNYEAGTYEVHHWYTIKAEDENLPRNVILPMGFTPQDLGLQESPLHTL